MHASLFFQIFVVIFHILFLFFFYFFIFFLSFNQANYTKGTNETKGSIRFVTGGFFFFFLNFQEQITTWIKLKHEEKNFHYCLQRIYKNQLATLHAYPLKNLFRKKISTIILNMFIQRMSITKCQYISRNNESTKYGTPYIVHRSRTKLR